jgi:hypothetical protein
MKTMTDMRNSIENHTGWVSHQNDAHSQVERRIVHVPNLVRLIHRGGGMEHVAGDQSGCRMVDFPTIASGASSRHKDGSFWLLLDGWYPTDSCLSVSFHVPKDWELGQWQVRHVWSLCCKSINADLNQLVGECCDQIIGGRLADESVRPWCECNKKAP